MDTNNAEEPVAAENGPAAEPETLAPEIELGPDAQVLALIYTGPAGVFIFDGVRFVPGVPTSGSAALIERLAQHPLAAEGHRLTPAE